MNLLSFLFIICSVLIVLHYACAFYSSSESNIRLKQYSKRVWVTLHETGFRFINYKVDESAPKRNVMECNLNSEKPINYGGASVYSQYNGEEFVSRTNIRQMDVTFGENSNFDESSNDIVDI